MGFEISKIDDASLKTIANKADTNRDGYLDTSELENYEESLWAKSDTLKARKSENDLNDTTLAGLLAATGAIFGLSVKNPLNTKVLTSKLVKNLMRKGVGANNIRSLAFCAGVIGIGALGYGVAELEAKVRDKIIDKKLQNIDTTCDNLSQLYELC